MLEPIGSASQHAASLGAHVPRELDAWFASALAPHPRSRFASVLEMVGEFARIAAKLPAAAPRQAVPLHVEPSHEVIEAETHQQNRMPPGIMVASAQPLAFMASLPPPQRGASIHKSGQTEDAGQSEITAEHVSPLKYVAVASTLLLALSAVAFGALLFQTGSKLSDQSSPSPTTSAPAARNVAEREQIPPSAAPVATETPTVAPETWPAQAEPTAEADPLPTPGSGDAIVVFQCVPSNCDSVWCNGSLAESFPGPVTLPPGRHVCKALKQGYHTTSQTFSLEPGERAHAHLRPNQAGCAA
jgi:hypothetical protein